MIWVSIANYKAKLEIRVFFKKAIKVSEQNRFKLTSTSSCDPRSMFQQTNAYIFATMVNHTQVNASPGLDFYQTFHHVDYYLVSITALKKPTTHAGFDLLLSLHCVLKD